MFDYRSKDHTHTDKHMAARLLVDACVFCWFDMELQTNRAGLGVCKCHHVLQKLD